MPLVDSDIASGLKTQVYRLVKLMRKEAHNDEGLSLTERSTLALLLDSGAMLPGELAAVEKVTTQAISQVIAHLEELGFLRRTPSEEDRRKVIVTLTDAGRKFVSRRRDEKVEWLTHAISEKLNAREKQVLTDSIPILAKLLGQ